MLRHRYVRVIGVLVIALTMITGTLPRATLHSAASPTTRTCFGQGAGGWAFWARTDTPYGLAVYDPRLGPRYLATSLLTSYIEITADWADTGLLSTERVALGESLSPLFDLPAPILIGFSCRTGSSDSIGVSATYNIEGLPHGVRMWVQQSYRFDHPRPGDYCEATGKLICARFWPTVTWGADDTTGGTRPFVHDVRIVQRFGFEPDALVRGAGDIFHDEAGAATLSSGISMKYEDRVRAIVKGQRIVKTVSTVKRTLGKGDQTPFTWDSYHQTERDALGGPGTNPLSLSPGFHPGCSECVHVHWAWSRTSSAAKVVNKILKGQNPLSFFSDGKPEILDGSKQTAWIAVIKQSDQERDIDLARKPEGYCWLLDNPGTCTGAGVHSSDAARLRGCLTFSKGNECGDPAKRRVDAKEPLAVRPVMFWDTDMPWDGPKGVTLTDVSLDGAPLSARFTHGDAAWPQLSNKKHGGNGSMFFAPARLLGRPARWMVDSYMATDPRWVSVTYLSAGLAPRLPAGYVLPVAISFTPPSCGTHAPPGPYWIAVDTGNGQRLLNPSGIYSDAPGGTPYVTLVENDRFTPGNPPRFDTDKRYGPYEALLTGLYCHSTAYAYLVFAQPPTSDNVSLTLLGPPNGDDHYIPFIE